MQKEKFQREYMLNVSRPILYNRLITPSGLSDWFADDVNIKGDVFSFLWEGSAEQARLLGKRREEFVKFRWLEAEDEGEDTYFEFRIKTVPLTGETVLIVTDHADSDEIEEATLLWDSQIDKLKRILGS